MNKPQDDKDHVLERFDEAIKYYWRASRHNKKWYKVTRILVVILGATVTLVASLSSASFIEGHSGWDMGFAIASPVLAAILTIAGGFSQTFHWGAAWRDMVLNAQRLERERDQILVADEQDRDHAKELAILNEIVITETKGFFQRVLGGAKGVKGENDEQE